MRPVVAPSRLTPSRCAAPTVGVPVSTSRRPPPRRVRRPRASSRAGQDGAERCHGAGRRWPSTSEHGAEPDARGRQEERRPAAGRAPHGGGIKIALARMRAKSGRDRLVTDLAANVSKLSGVHTGGVRLELVSA